MPAVRASHDGLLVRALLVLLLLAGCGGGKKQPAPASGCDLSGTYRTRFDAGVGQWLWFRFAVDASGQKATMVQPSAIEQTATLSFDPDPAACKATVIAKTQAGEILASITLDPKTQKVTGKLRMVGAREGVALEGVHDPASGPIHTRACVTPGRYKLFVPAEQSWIPEASCTSAHVEVPFLVEEFGDKLSIDQLDDDGSAAWTAEDYVEKGPCSVLLRFRNRDYSALVELTFDKDKVTASGFSASVFVVDHGDRVKCEAAAPMAWVEKVPG